ncbi:exonuclease SbcCD subunit D C-terminal domain-containing protein [Flammeovirga kamogawensis]|uniref:Nuclease SbcCD subunit D n=1 Tax=Flammeovirga kamogawensis TaxID=373891 RepID=A0ABX8GVK0_9BACT|nr:exonuclease SbcCD subunit D C-terminal domain-containing protein [Flammeovirga kamogawensis]MBB6459764.1 exonuclease SbcD [Flammeovirga kamogawensis]QWG07177.1 exonuclease SbcCD subunit D C-terminal domain-containing protein [Flammeovirga kamogawensis]TRX68998.1 exonuclease subunit SbcD [Flammeovirga kamogawensis]
MKMLHTADWHIGKKLYDFSLNEDFRRFIDWLNSTIRTQNIDVLLIAGDIFDTAYPSTSSQEIYFDSLAKLRSDNPTLQIIITDGNHDSTSALNAAKIYLKRDNISVVSGLTDTVDDEIIYVKNTTGAIEAVVAAVPFLRDRDIRKVVDNTGIDDRYAAIKEGIKKHYDEVANRIAALELNKPVIAMGHLYTHGVSSDPDSEREIQMGHQAGVEGNIFSEVFDYVALGHIHMAQTVKGNVPIYYSGSPIPLSFSERKYKHTVRLINIDTEVSSSAIEIPKFRILKKIVGSLEEVKEKIVVLNVSSDQLTCLVELEIVEPTYNPLLQGEIEAFKAEFNTRNKETNTLIIKSRFSFDKSVEGADELYDETVDISELTPLDIFTRRIDDERTVQLETDFKSQLIDAFKQLTEEVEIKEGE